MYNQNKIPDYLPNLNQLVDKNVKLLGVLVSY